MQFDHRAIIPHPIRKIITRSMPRSLARLTWNVGNDLKYLPNRLHRETYPEPWRIMHNVGGGDYHSVGKDIAALIHREIQFEPDWHLLDVGCGTGRVAIHLFDQLNDQGSYTGFDISKSAIRWARSHVQPHYAKARFLHADLSNKEYRARRGKAADQYQFPAQENTIDLALAISLYTHLLAEEAQAYLQETGRVLKPFGKLFATAFIMDQDALENTENGTSTWSFKPIGNQSYALNPAVPEQAIAFDEDAVMAWIEAAGLKLDRPIRRGTWSRKAGTTGQFQDILILSKP